MDEGTQQQIRSARGGVPLENGTRRQMERGFGADFSKVRIHTDSTADTLNRSLNAHAFTRGSNIFFKRGEYSPATSGGKRLLAHELTHTIQQNAVQPQAISRSGTGGAQDMVQAKFMNATKKMPWVRIYSGEERPDPKVSKATINHLFSRTLEVDPNQTYKNGRTLWVRARVVKQSGVAENAGWIKWSDVQWAGDVNPELEHQVGDKFFGLAQPFGDDVHNTLSGYGTRKEKAIALYQKHQKDPGILDKLATKKSKHRALVEAKLAIGGKLAKAGNVHGKGAPQTSNEHFINTMDSYLGIPLELFELHESGKPTRGVIDSHNQSSWKTLQKMDPQDRKMMADINAIPTGQAGNGFQDLVGVIRAIAPRWHCGPRSAQGITYISCSTALAWKT